MTYDEALRFWFGRVNYEQRTPLPGDLKLDRMHSLLDLLGNPEKKLRIVHIAGSKGKGSTSAMVASIARQAGYRVGLFTSPHLSAIEERIQVDGVSIAPAELAALMADVAPCVDKIDSHRAKDAVGVTFFEIATAVGLLHFVRRRVDLAVLEVGLGGRFDSTNVCDPLLAIIVSISHDHTQQLGNTLASIATEKAGIIKPGRPVLSGARAPAARAVIEDISRQRGASLQQLGVDIQYRHVPGVIHAESTTFPLIDVTTRARQWPTMRLGLLGEHQAANAALAVAAVEQLRLDGLHITDAAVASGLKVVHWPARLEVLGRRPLVIMDCAHNVASAAALVDALKESYPGPNVNAGSVNGNQAAGRRLLIFAGSGDKDIAGMFHHFAGYFSHAYLTRYTQSTRGVPAESLQDLWVRAGGGPATIHKTPHEAWQAAAVEAKPQDLICIAGSVFLAGELRPTLLQL
jgi:dihydrofolate synthase/folylpolyglutamate synthase